MPQSISAPASVSDAHTKQPTLEGKRVLVTGGTTGIGRATAVLLASAGCNVFICGRDESHLADALDRIGQVGTGDGMAIDLNAPSAVEALFDAAEKAWGGLDVVIVNAAVPASDLAGTASADLEYLVGVDFTAYLRTAREAAIRLGPGSDIVLVGSMSAVSQRPGSSVYVAAKTGIEGLAPALRKELADQDIKVGLIEPGFTGADFQYPEFPPERQRALIHEHKMLRAEDIAVAIHFVLTQPRRCAVSLMRVETRLTHP